jgi:magnesium chelatase subunit D
MNAAHEAAMVASLFAVDPAGTGGVCLRSQVHPARDQWLQLLRELLPEGTPLRRIPFNIPDGRLLGGLDLAATLQANRPIAERGVLAVCDGGVVIVAMAERLTAHTAACLNAVLDSGRVATSREGVMLCHDARVGIVALDEGLTPDECIAHSLLDRLAFPVDLNELSMHDELAPLHDSRQIRAARSLLPTVTMNAQILEVLCATALTLGAGSLRVSALACRAARAAAALEMRATVTERDAVVAAQLVLAPRASAVPSSQAEAEPRTAESQEPDPVPDPGSESGESPAEPAEDLQDRVLAATEAAIPRGLLAQLRENSSPSAGRSLSAGRAGALRRAGARGRPAGVRSGTGRGARLNVIETLRAAAPWQRLRGRNRADDARVRVEPGDFRATHYRQRSQTLTIFAVDASGSSALHRLAEAKGAVELLLADCYIRRDQVAVIAFRGRAAELSLPPTRSLVRAKRCLAGLAGGGGTPLAAAIAAAVVLGNQAQRGGQTATLVFLSDGRANVARNGAPGRESAHADALNAARYARQSRLSCLFIDTSPRPNALASDLAAAMNARYLPLPFADSRVLSNVVKAATSARAGNSVRM